MSRNYNFDEWRPWEQNASPLLLTLTLNAGMKNLKDYFGTALWTTVIIFEDKQAKWLFRPKELKALGQKMIDFLMFPPYRVAFQAGFDDAETQLIAKAKEIQFGTDLKALNDKQLVDLFEEFSGIYYEWYKFGWFCEPVQFQAQDILTSFLEKHVKKIKPDLDVVKATQTLFTIEEDSFTMAILGHLKECSEALSLALKNNQLAKEIQKISSEAEFPTRAAKLVLSTASNEEVLKGLIDKLKEHSSMFYWKQNNYFSTKFLTEEDILAELFAEDGFNISDPVSKIDSQLMQIKENKREVLADKVELLDILPVYYRNIAVLTSSIGGSLLDKRKKDIMIANAAFDRILSEVASHSKIDIDSCRLLIPQEIRYFIESPSEYQDRLLERRKRFVVYQGDFPLLDELSGDMIIRRHNKELDYSVFEMVEPFIAEGMQADKAIKQLNSRLNFFADSDETDLNKIMGVVTYYDPEESQMTGVARIIRDPKNEKLESGEILVSPSTTPDFIDAIRRCKAIITDWGGQTSHAAIVSRELRKPCIIGTNYASQVLRNGDRIQLDFAQGIIEILDNK